MEKHLIERVKVGDRGFDRSTGRSGKIVRIFEIMRAVSLEDEKSGHRLFVREQDLSLEISS